MYQHKQGTQRKRNNKQATRDRIQATENELLEICPSNDLHQLNVTSVRSGQLLHVLTARDEAVRPYGGATAQKWRIEKISQLGEIEGDS